MGNYIIENKNYSIYEIEQLVNSNRNISLSDNCIESVKVCRQYLDREIDQSNRIIYGINTGFGSLCDRVISKEELSQLQINLVQSHACGLGKRIPNHIVRRMILLKIIALAKGYSGVSIDTINRLILFYNHEVFPIVYEQGSLGASGDLAPLAHLSLPLIGLGYVEYKNKVMSSEELLIELDLKPIELKSKEGLALLNGTQFMSAFALYSVVAAKKILDSVNFISAISLDAFDCRIDPFAENVNEIRKQEGQIKVSWSIRKLLSDSEILKKNKTQVQDPYSFRCIPQVHGASLDVINFAAEIIEREVNAVTDNPTIFVDDDEVVSAGNFHGQPLALQMDFLAIALAEIGSISERRVYKLLSGTRGLPAFLAKNPGLNSGLMIAQYTCASIVSQNKQLATPASIDSIDSSNGQEDHVSMGANAAIKLFKIIDNCNSILGIELLCATQALEFRRPLRSSDLIESFIKDYRKEIKFIDHDIILSEIIKKSTLIIENTDFKINC